jgi:hypothetical protein
VARATPIRWCIMSFSSGDLTYQRIKSSTVIRGWKISPIIKGMLTYVPAFNAWRQYHATSGGTDTSRYCYSVWLRHLVMLDQHGFRITGGRVGELGPGDSIGIGLAALLSGATQYVGLDIVPFSAKADLETIFEELVQLYSRREPIPDHNEFPRVRPRLESYEFPNHFIDWDNFSSTAENVRIELRKGIGNGQLVDYRVPWTSTNEIAPGSLDLIFSQAVLEHVDDLAETYKAMSAWLKPGGYASHVVDFTAHGLSPFWNGHWAYSDRQWQWVRGRREYLLNRQPVSVHLACASRAGFEIIHVHKDYGDSGLDPSVLSKHFQVLDGEDLRTRGAVLILRKQ